ncbi:Translation initiation factor IF-3 [Erysiphe necator]|nr:Translation initiation factor IF-3 [Erysiphe necator]
MKKLFNFALDSKHLRSFTYLIGCRKIKPVSRSTRATFFVSLNAWSHLFSQHHSAALSTSTTIKPKKLRLPRNEEITAESITVVDENGKISGPHQTKNFFEDFDLENKSLVTILEGNPEDGRPPLCRIYDRSLLRKKEINDLKNKGKIKVIPTKTLEISWTVDENDLNIKLRRLKEFLEKGCHVDLFLKAKKRGRPVTLDEGEKIVQRIQNTVKEAGGKENLSPVGDLLGTMEMSFSRKKTT